MTMTCALTTMSRVAAIGTTAAWLLAALAHANDDAPAPKKPPANQVASAQPKPQASHIDLDETVISGNQELPKVLYIVPWQDSSGMPSIKLDPEFTEHEVFRHLYPPAYKRELEYYELLDASKKED